MSTGQNVQWLCYVAEIAVRQVVVVLAGKAKERSKLGFACWGWKRCDTGQFVRSDPDAALADLLAWICEWRTTETDDFALY